MTAFNAFAGDGRRTEKTNRFPVTPKLITFVKII
jgi:hypothetical protein